MDFLDHPFDHPYLDERSMAAHVLEEPAHEVSDRGLPHIDGAVSHTIAQAIRDATQSADPARQREAASWLLICCPDIAEQVDLPDLHVDAMAALAAAYVVGVHATVGAHASHYSFG